MAGRDWLNIVVLGVHAGAAVTWLAALALAAALTWLLHRAPHAPRAEQLRALRRRSVPVIWGGIAVLVATGLYNRSHNAAVHVPSPWAVADIADAYERAYALIFLGKQVLAAQALLALAIVTPRLASLRPQRSEVATGLVTTAGLVSGALILGATALLGYTHMLIPAHVH